MGLSIFCGVPDTQNNDTGVGLRVNHLNATTIMIGKKIADNIRGRTPLLRSNADDFVARESPIRGKLVRA
ncbi:hypothetical protein E0L21_00960 [Kosakonia quasisacchari]|uniref:Uncharacterized protein n=1 Tax=Kosakonia quasisacchari TaxID=2529380 RepID=A0A4R0I3L7_9ENTR|nr:hypothetical protein [Kosakonia quasisacchari]TCC14859.1 hypothetical protein E0L21_00960 [Kosakonia quasisacchari]